jgi:tetratricopeptide (TPR) repeat protein
MNETPPPDSGVIDLLAWFELNKKKLAIAAAAIIAAGFTIAVIRYQKEQKEIQAGGALLNIRTPAGAPTNTPPPGPSEYLKVAETFSGTAAAERAEFMAATAYFTEGKYSEAQQAFRKYLNDNSSATFAPGAAYGVAASLEAQNKLDEALQEYQRVATTYSKSSVVNDAKLAQARIYELKKQPEQALRIYNELAATAGLAAMGERQEFALKRERLLKAHPELDTNRPPASFSPPVSAPVNKPAATNAPAPAASTNVPAAAAGTNTPAPAAK